MDMKLYVFLKKESKKSIFRKGLEIPFSPMETEMYKLYRRIALNKFKYANELIVPLTKGIKRLKKIQRLYDPFVYPTYGWGNYYQLHNFLYDCLTACQENPDALAGSEFKVKNKVIRDFSLRGLADIWR